MASAKKIASWMALLGVMLLVIAAGAALYGRSLLEPVSDAGEDQVFEVKRGAAFVHVARDLEDAGLIRNANAARLLARVNGADLRLKPGEYDVSPRLSTQDILELLTSGRVKTYAVVLPEGIRANEIAQRLEEAGLAESAAFLEVVDDADLAHELGLPADRLEGYLFPDTYRLPRDLQPRDIARVLVQRFLRVWNDIEPHAEKREMSMHEVVTLASIVEKETGVADERPLIAGVFHNRLKRGMRLETDPTVIYGIADFDGNIRKHHLLDGTNPYNTYKISGLPPGPIASPGREALIAVVKPTETDYLFFVSRNDGSHYFSSTYEEHVNAVNRYQLRRRSN